MLIEKFSGVILSLKDIKSFIERAETLGYTDRTPIGQVGVGIELYIEVPQRADTYRCEENGCGKEFDRDQMARSLSTGDMMLPAHPDANRAFSCRGAGKRGIASS